MRDKLYSLWAAGLALCVVFSVFSLFFASCTRQQSPEETAPPESFSVETEAPAATPGQETAPPAESAIPEETAAIAPGARLAETEDAGRDYLDKLTFLGDSTTYGIGYYYEHGYSELCPPAQIWTPKSGTLTLSYYAVATVVYPETGEELSIADAAARARPEYLVITLGVNGIAFMDEEWFIRDYTALVRDVQAASPDTRIILNSIYPVAKSYAHQDQINNEKITAANGWIERVAENTGTKFLNSFEAVVGPDGALPEESQNGDGLHLTGEAFNKVMAYIRTHAYL